MNYKELDSRIRFTYYKDKIDVIKALGYSYISEAVIDLYVNQRLSMPKIAKIMNQVVTSQMLTRWLQRWGIQPRSRGGDTYIWPWPDDNCIRCGKKTYSGVRLHGMHNKCYREFKRGTKNWRIKYSKSAGGLTRLKADFGIAQNVDDKLLISVLNRS